MDVSAFRRPVGPVALLVGLTFVVASVSFALAGTFYDPHPGVTAVFFYLFRRDEPLAALLSCVLALAAAGFARRVPDSLPERIAERLTKDPRAFVAVVTAGLAVAAVVVYRAFPLAMDESAAVFQARAFAHLHLTGKVPPELVDRIVLHVPFWFLQALPTGEVIQSYWPSFALLLTPFAALGVPWLLNPVVGGATLLALHRLARRLSPGTSAPGWAMLLAAASPAFTGNAISFYSMPVHLLATLLFCILMLEERWLLAGLVGSVALTLHNPLPHTLVAVPFLVWVLLRKDRVRAAAWVSLGYLPGIVVGVAWFVFRAQFAAPNTGGGGGAPGLFSSMMKFVFAAPDMDLLRDRVIALCELSLWAPPALLALACWAAWRMRRDTAALLVSLTAVVTLAGYTFVPFDQGHGWGFRYFHPAWGVLPLFGAAAIVALGPSVRKMMLLAAAGSLLFNNGLRFHQIQSFIDERREQIPTAPSHAGFEVVMVHVNKGYYTVDLVQNDPFLDSNRWMLISKGPADDRHFMKAAFPKAKLVVETPIATVWQIE